MAEDPDLIGEVDDTININLALSMLARRKGDAKQYAACPIDDTPLISTLKYRGAEFLCMACGTLYGFLAPKPLPATPELDIKYALLQEAFERGEKPWLNKQSKSTDQSQSPT